MYQIQVIQKKSKEKGEPCFFHAGFERSHNLI